MQLADNQSANKIDSHWLIYRNKQSIPEIKTVDYRFVVRLRFADFREFGAREEEIPWMECLRKYSPRASTTGWPAARHRGRL